MIFGRHLIVDLFGIKRDLLNDADAIGSLLARAAAAAGATVIDSCSHSFSPHGVTATVTLAESHISLHSWPENGYCALDIFVCGSSDPFKALEVIRDHFLPLREQVVELPRGESEDAL
ncbi:MAG: adenosylmethionine decarboxylase [Candidatus Brocadiia bacterium]